MKKTIAQIIDELSITNIKIFMLVDKVQKDEHPMIVTGKQVNFVQ